MHKPAAVSPFAALNSQQQKEQWICWQSQKQNEEMSTISKPTDGDLWSESVLKDTKPTGSREGIKIHHGQYDAVLARMKKAQKQTHAYIEC